jgi:uncharacterized membrane protein YedE/YeeE
MMYWPWWLGGMSLAGVMLFHWVATRRMMAVSGRYTALVNRLRFGPRSQGDDGATVDTAARDHLVFLGCLALGGAVAAVTSGRLSVSALLASTGFARMTHGSIAAGATVLVLGGACVGFGTRMAGGCTSGHGMCGVSRLQGGSLLATAAFFGTGVATAFALGWVP